MTIKIFCDFDGTITDSDNIVAIMKQFGPSETESIKNKVLQQEISIREGVTEMFALLPSTLKEDMITSVKQKALIRPGFSEFIKFIQKQRVEFYVVSGGMDFFVYPLLDSLIDRSSIYCNEADFTGTSIQVNWIHSCDNICKNECGLCKPSIIRKLTKSEDYKIVIGDSITDLQAAKLADKVFARDFLAAKCEELDITYTPFTTFSDIQIELESILGVNI
ncbi:2-hydroxy-3-keto-5-methylthiopentenyl-1-phosphate phosphatase [Bacillus sp. 165]|uniref:2-hydroxy-3-keto-5-methylthiopentenyl-1- phosphate phosphatase n=1 Tax=Bacillus sp. 165 TaxID=1529117 RepID=UPI001ADCF251|nr:2-hydroxy-3-keto-5-methylthiopentenyl-1-phosphate phosphatase [Bacillus sp. 165]MBO9129871.1 2-hydroxy-3-keto-5-methylthiopentenyl-1-phosphate phosphatase [Bacillus sp. 165]